eukprot:s3420_g2.t1
MMCPKYQGEIISSTSCEGVGRVAEEFLGGMTINRIYRDPEMEEKLPEIARDTFDMMNAGQGDADACGGKDSISTSMVVAPAVSDSLDMFLAHEPGNAHPCHSDVPDAPSESAGGHEPCASSDSRPSHIAMCLMVVAAMQHHFHLPEVNNIMVVLTALRQCFNDDTQTSPMMHAVETRTVEVQTVSFWCGAYQEPAPAEPSK